MYPLHDNSGKFRLVLACKILEPPNKTLRESQYMPPW